MVKQWRVTKIGNLERLMNRNRLALALVVVPLSLLTAIQLVPYGRAHANPPVVKEPAWDKPETRALAVRACFDCHSNETTWPWYSNVAPFSWVVQDHVDEGREYVNFSEWNKTFDEAGESANEVREGEMPIAAYAWLHPAANLSATEKAALIGGLAATFGDEGGRAEGGGAAEGQEEAGDKGREHE